MALKDALPPTVLAAARLARTYASLAGLRDPNERRLRDQSLTRMAAQPRAANQGRRVLVFSFRGGWYPHTAWEAVLAHSLRLRGVEVHLFNCGGRLPICEVNLRHANPGVACRECAAYPRELARVLDLPRTWLADYVTLEETAQIDSAVRKVKPAEYRDWSYQGQPVGDLVHDAVLWFLRKSAVGDTRGDWQVYADFLRAGAALVVASPRLLKRTTPDVVLELNGRFFAERILNRFVPNEIPIVIYEAGWRRNTLGFDRLGSEGLVDLDDAWKAMARTPLTATEDATLDRWIHERTSGDMQRDFYIRFQSTSQNPLAALGLDPQRPTAILFTNLVWDTAVLGHDEAFPSIQAWLRATIEMFATRPEWQLVVRIHPAEDLRPSQESNEKLGDEARTIGTLPPNVRLIGSAQEMSSYSLMDACTAVLVYTSTTGLEAALRGKPTVVAARVYYRGRGFTSDVFKAGQYSQLLDRAMSGSFISPTIECARRFAYLLLFRYLHQIPVVRQRPAGFPLLEPEDVDRLTPRGDEAFNQLVDAIAAGGPFVRMS